MTRYLSRVVKGVPKPPPSGLPAIAGSATLSNCREFLKLAPPPAP